MGHNTTAHSEVGGKESVGGLEIEGRPGPSVSRVCFVTLS